MHNARRVSKLSPSRPGTLRVGLWHKLSVALLACASLIAASSDAQADDLWTPACTPSIIQVFPNRVVAKCAQNNTWYKLMYRDHEEAYVDRVVRILQAVQLSGKTVKIRYTTGSSPYLFDAVAQYR